MVHDSYVDQVVAQVETKMLLRELAHNTIETYVRCVRRFIAEVGKPLGAVKAKDVEQYLLDLAHQDRSPVSFSEETCKPPRTTAPSLSGYPQEKPIKIDHLAP
jgi:hypothetical protein